MPFALALAAMLLLSPRAAQGTDIITFLAPVPISPEAIAAEPSLAGYQAWDLRIHVPAGENWGYTGFLAELTDGSFYNSSIGANWPLPPAWDLFPQLRYDTFVTQAANPNDDSTFRAPQWNSGYPDYPAAIEFTDTRISVVYLSLYGTLTGPGEFTIGRLTLSNDAQGSIIGFTAGRSPDTPAVSWDFPLPIPEPASIGIACGAVGLLLSNRPARRNVSC